ncbi:MAG: threonine synthase [Treponema sp.]|nr:threonine synthase [Treponema sp.]
MREALKKLERGAYGGSVSKPLVITVTIPMMGLPPPSRFTSYLNTPVNFWCPSIKITGKETLKKGKLKKYYGAPKTPYQRLLKSLDISPDVKKRLVTTQVYVIFICVLKCLETLRVPHKGAPPLSLQSASVRSPFFMILLSMRYYSTRNKTESVGFAIAALTGLAPDGGLFVPQDIPEYSGAVKSSLGCMSYQDIAVETIRPYVDADIPCTVLEEMVLSAYPFGAPLVAAGDRLVLELFHGPTAAFKDFGARFMARAFSYLRRGEDNPLRILVATSGDTGGAVADGFFGVEGISVTVLYPKGRVSPLQERQIAGLGGNISALAVEGSFDDCQRLVKAAFADAELRGRLDLSSANSINISRLIPQAVYYTAAAGKAFAGKLDEDGAATPRVKLNVPPPRIPHPEKAPITLCVPSGNFGNLTAGLYAMKMGAPIKRFIAATNINKTVPDYLESGNYAARLSQATISNAMDVGAPSNFERMAAHFSWEQMRGIILGASVNDEDTRKTIRAVHDECGYFLDPHSAVGWRAVDHLKLFKILDNSPLAILATAHPAKFAETVENLTGPIPVPPSLKKAMERKATAQTIPAELSALKDVLV